MHEGVLPLAVQEKSPGISNLIPAHLFYLQKPTKEIKKERNQMAFGTPHASERREFAKSSGRMSIARRSFWGGGVQ